MAPEKPRKKMGRPTRYDKGLVRTFLIDQDAEDLVNEHAESLRCSRSDALVDLLKQNRQRRKRAS